MPRSSPASPSLCAVLIFVFFLALFGLTGSKLRYGYLGQNIEQAEALIAGTWQIRPEGGITPVAKTGAFEIAAYLPFAAAKLYLERQNRLPGFRQLAYVFVEPFYTALLSLALFGLVYRLYRNVSTAVAVTLILGLATMIWPYSKFGMETQITLWTVVGLWALVGYDQRGGMASALLLGISCAALLLTKITGPLHAAMLLACAAWLSTQHRWWLRAGAKRAAFIILILFAVGGGVFLITNRWRYGGWLWAGRYGFASELQPISLWESAWAFLLSPNKSIFLFSPPVLIALWYFSAFLRRFDAMRPVFFCALLITLFHLSARTWAEETWGPRRMHYLLPLLILPLGVWWEQRHLLETWVRRLCWLAIAFGFWVQCLAISFDYTALAFTLGHHPRFSQEHYLWDPQYNHLRFNYRLVESAIYRSATGESLPYFLTQHYMPWTYDPAMDRGPQPPGSEAFDLKKYDHFALWPLEQRRDWPDRPYWFVSPSSWLAAGLLALSIISFTGLLFLVRRSRE